MFIAQSLLHDVRLSVRLSVTRPFVSKQLNVSANFLHLRVVTPFWFIHTKPQGNITTRPPNGSVKCRSGVKKSANISFYLGNDTDRAIVTVER